MRLPQVELLPFQAALPARCGITLDLLVKIVPPVEHEVLSRPPLNLGLVIDRSSSMSRYDRIAHAQRAASFAVQQLLPSDRISVVTFDRNVQTLIPNTLATHKADIIWQIEQIQLGYGTNLHAGWIEGAYQVNQQFQVNHLNRVIVLSDGWVSVGETNSDVICSSVQLSAQRGISTSTMGVGDGYHEDLMEGIARGGEGRYYYIDTPEHLANIFRVELHDLARTVGRRVTLGIEPQGHIEVVDVLNDLDVTRQGRFKLPNLVSNNPIMVVVRLKIPPLIEEQDLCYFRLGWHSAEDESPQTLRIPFRLPIVRAARLAEFPVQTVVLHQVLLMQSARSKQQAVQLIDASYYDTAVKCLREMRQQLLRYRATPIIEKEIQSLENLEADLQARRFKRFRKRSKFDAYETTMSY